jgi:hypothetical protein
MKQGSGIEIREYRPGDEHGLVDLFERCSGRAISVAHWRWKMQGGNPGFDNIWIATHLGRPVGQYAASPVVVWVHGERQPAAAVFDVMVDPAMRRAGVLTRMAILAHDCWRKAGVHFAFGLPNEQWGGRIQALGIKPLFSLRWLVRILRPESLLARHLGIDSLARLASAGALARRLLGGAAADPSIELHELHEASDDLDIVAGKALRPDTVHPARGSAWVKQRYMNCPSADYHVLLATRGDRPVAYGVYSLSGSNPRRAAITEVTTAVNDQAAYAALVHEIERRCLDCGVDSIRILAAPGTHYYRRLRQYGFLPRRAAFEFHYVSLRQDMQPLTHLDTWHFQGGDFDVV